jgi:oxygen-independent coproporphyrinogen-3 oxidase
MTTQLATVEAKVEEAPELPTYAYSYPHKSSYRPLPVPIQLREVWQDEDRSRLALYVHLPFCEMRCGFCNLFTQSQPESDAVASYLDALTRQMRVVHEELPGAEFRQFALGGGTPTFLSACQLESLFREVESQFGVHPAAVPTSVETSPATATADRLRVLKDRGVERISLGVQSFVETDAHRIGRPQRSADVHGALNTIREFKFPVLNIDLIYGGAGQTREDWQASLQAALEYEPEELFLYPLYVRPETGLARTGCNFANHQVELYRIGRERLLEAGYEQLSLRCFRQPRPACETDYCCQRDGMVGLGCGGRSYTRSLHYASRFAVTQAGIRALLLDWIAQSDADFAVATYGIHLNEDEQRRRHVILSVLHSSGLNCADYEARFQSTPLADVPQLASLIERGWVEFQDGRFLLTESGLENSDLAGPLLYSTTLHERLKQFVRL